MDFNRIPEMKLSARAGAAGRVTGMTDRNGNVRGLLCGSLIVAGCMGVGTARAVDHPDLFGAWSDQCRIGFASGAAEAGAVA